MAENLNISVKGVCYEKKLSNCNIYGGLYDWETAMEICPDGWRLPNNSEFIALTSKYSSVSELKDKSGFAPLLGGNKQEEFSNITISGYWWSADTEDNSKAYMFFLNDKSSQMGLLTSDKTTLCSVRCVEDK